MDSSSNHKIHEKTSALQMEILKIVGATLFANNLLIGDQLGLFKAMKDSAPVTEKTLAQKTHTHERYVKEWLINQTANGVLEYNPQNGTYTLPVEHVPVVADEDGPLFSQGSIQAAIGITSNIDKVINNFKTGEGIAWYDQGKHVSEGAKRFFRPAYEHSLVQNWIPCLDSSIQEKLKKGAHVADIGCGHGISTRVLAKAFPNSKFVGVDYDNYSIQIAKETGKGISNLSFEVRDAKTFTDNNGKFDLITIFDSFHDMNDPKAVARSLYSLLSDHGAVMLVEPVGNDKVEDNFNLVGKIYSGFSTTCCLQTAHFGKKCDVALGTVASPSLVEKILKEAGFQKFRDVQVPNPFHRVFEAIKN